MQTTTLSLIARGGAASPAYLNIEATLTRARHLLDVARPNPRALRALVARLGSHAEQSFRDHVRETPTTLPAGLTVNLPTWSSDYARLTYRLLITYRQQAEQRIAELAQAAR